MHQSMTWDVYALGVTIFEMMVGGTRSMKWIVMAVGPPQIAMPCFHCIKIHVRRSKGVGRFTTPMRDCWMWIKRMLYLVFALVQDVQVEVHVPTLIS
jgi:hypothetical protein